MDLTVKYYAKISRVQTNITKDDGSDIKKVNWGCGDRDQLPPSFLLLDSLTEEIRWFLTSQVQSLQYYYFSFMMRLCSKEPSTIFK